MKKRRAFTIVELILSVSLLTVVMMSVFGIFNMSVKSERMVQREYNIQSSLRDTLDEMNKRIRYSKGVFAVPETYVESTSKMDSMWSYLMVSKDKKRVVVMEYDEAQGKHVERVLVPEEKDVEYEIKFKHDKDSDKILHYEIVANVIGDDNKVKSKKILFESAIESVNAEQVVDKGSNASPAIALSYTRGGLEVSKKNTQTAYITLILDTSGSMRWIPGRNVTPSTNQSSRMELLKEALMNDGGIIDKLGGEDNIYLSVIPFDTTANPDTTFDHEPVKLDRREANSLKDNVNRLNAEGGTNTGDALRRAYWQHQNFESKVSLSSGTNVNHYMIVLVDGETTYELKKVNRWTSSGGWNPRWSPVISGFYLDEGPRGNLNPTAWTGNPLSRQGSDVVRTGNGNTVIPNTNSITYNINNPNNFKATERNTLNYHIGQKIKSEPIKSYLIGYNSGAGFNKHIYLLGGSIGVEEEYIYKYDDPDFDLDGVFTTIVDDILADYWLLTGPEIN